MLCFSSPLHQQTVSLLTSNSCLLKTSCALFESRRISPSESHGDIYVVRSSIFYSNVFMPDVHDFISADKTGMTGGLHTNTVFWTGPPLRSHCRQKHTRVHPSAPAFVPPSLYPVPLGYFLAIRIHLLFLPVISVPACSLRHFVYFVLF